MKPRLLGPLAALAFAFVPQAQAQSFNGTYCTAGSLRACSSTEIWNELDPETGIEYLFVRLANPQGSAGFTDLAGSGLSLWSISNLDVVPEEGAPAGVLPERGYQADPSMQGTLSGRATYCERASPEPPFGESCTSEYDGVGDFPTLDQLPDGSWLLSELVLGGTLNMIWGCDVGQAYDVFIYTTTCGHGHVTWRLLGYGYNPLGNPSNRYRLSFRLTERSAVTFGFHDATLETTAFCTAGVDCAMVTPEPATLLLLGSGLVGVAVVARRRRTNAKGTES